MPKEAQAHSDQKKPRRKKKSRLNIGLREILIGAGLLLLGLIVTTSALNQITEHAKFVTVNALSIFVLVAIAIQALIYRQQREIMDKAADYTKIGERAYIGIKGINLENLTVGSEAVVGIKFLNGGRTPAWNVTATIRMVIGTRFPTERPTRVRSESNLLPAGIDTETRFNTLILITQEVYEDITEGRVKIFIRGEVRFKDAWNDRRKFRFNLVYGPTEGRFGNYHPQDQKPETAATPEPKPLDP